MVDNKLYSLIQLKTIYSSFFPFVYFPAIVKAAGHRGVAMSDRFTTCLLVEPQWWTAQTNYLPRSTFRTLWTQRRTWNRTVPVLEQRSQFCRCLTQQLEGRYSRRAR